MPVLLPLVNLNNKSKSCLAINILNANENHLGAFILQFSNLTFKSFYYF